MSDVTYQQHGSERGLDISVPQFPLQPKALWRLDDFIKWLLCSLTQAQMR